MAAGNIFAAIPSGYHLCSVDDYCKIQGLCPNLMGESYLGQIIRGYPFKGAKVSIPLCVKKFKKSNLLQLVVIQLLHTIIQLHDTLQ